MNKRYFIREGHLMGFFMGLLLARHMWWAIAWGVLVLSLYLWSVFTDAEEKDPPELFEEIKPDDLLYVMTDDERVKAIESQASMWDILREQGFNPEREIRWYDDPIRGTRIFKQER